MTTVGELGTLTNLQRHTFPSVLEDNLAVYLGHPLSKEYYPPQVYSGRPRLMVPTVQTTAPKGKGFKLRILQLSATPCTPVRAYVQPLGGNNTEPKVYTLQNVARQVFEVTTDPVTSDFEWYAVACTDVPIMFP